jgi:hypothetical protein
LAYAITAPRDFQADLEDVIGVVTHVVNANYKAGLVRYRLAVRIGSVAMSFDPLCGISSDHKGMPKNAGAGYRSARPVDSVALLFILRCLAGLDPSFSKFAQLAFVSDEDFATRVGAVCAWITGRSKGITVAFGLSDITLTCRTMEYVQAYTASGKVVAQSTGESAAA